MLESVKSYLRITWDSENAELLQMINRGERQIERLTGTTIDFDEDLVAQDLLLDYCRYSYNNALEYFEDNFQKQILSLQLHEAIRVGEDDDTA